MNDYFREPKDRTMRSMTQAAVLAATLASLSLLCSQAGWSANPAPSADDAFAAAAVKTEAGDYAGALALVQSHRNDPKLGARNLSLLGLLYLETGHAAEALAVLTPIATPQTAEPAVLYNAGRAAVATGKADLAQTYFSRSISSTPGGDNPSIRELGMLYARQGKVVEAYKLLVAWATAHPENTEPHMMAALMAIRLGQREKAAQLIAGLDPALPAVQLLQAELAVEAGDGATAVKILTPMRAKHEPAMEADIRKTLAEGMLLTGDAKGALALLSEKPTASPTFKLLLASAQRQSGDNAAAVATLKPLADLLPNGPQGLPDPRVGSGIALEYGRDLIATGATPQALLWIERATRINPYNRSAWKALADAYDKAGRANDAAVARGKADALRTAAQPASPAQH